MKKSLLYTQTARLGLKSPLLHLTKKTQLFANIYLQRLTTNPVLAKFITNRYFGANIRVCIIQYFA